MAFHFPDVERSGDERRPGESLWNFLLRSAWPEAEAVRTDLATWLNEYPAEDRGRLLSRLSSGVEAETRSAHSELVMHAILRRLVPTVDIEPTTPTGGLTDFLVPEAGLDFEVYRLNTNRERAAADQRVADLVAGLEKESNADFWLKVNVQAPGSKLPSMRPVRHEIREWLGSLDWEAQRAGDFVPQERIWQDEGAGWRIEVSAWPRAATARGTGPAVGMKGLDPFNPGIESLRDRLLNKLDQHRGLTRPLVLVADLSAATFIHDDEIEDALYGVTVLDTRQAPPKEYRRRLDCVWPEPSAQGPAAVLVMQRLHFGTARDAKLTWLLPPGTQACPLAGPWEVARLREDDRVHRDEAAFDLRELLDRPPLRTQQAK